MRYHLRWATIGRHRQPSCRASSRSRELATKLTFRHMARNAATVSPFSPLGCCQAPCRHIERVDGRNHPRCINADYGTSGALGRSGLPIIGRVVTEGSHEPRCLAVRSKDATSHLDSHCDCLRELLSRKHAVVGPADTQHATRPGPATVYSPRRTTLLFVSGTTQVQATFLVKICLASGLSFVPATQGAP
jgi:hypothetical protein